MSPLFAAVALKLLFVRKIALRCANHPNHRAICSSCSQTAYLLTVFRQRRTLNTTMQTSLIIVFVVVVVAAMRQIKQVNNRISHD